MTAIRKLNLQYTCFQHFTSKTTEIGYSNDRFGIINDKGEILNFMFTPGNVDDLEPLKQKKFLKNIKGKLCADKRYIGQTMFENLFLGGIQLITKVKNNMKNSLMSVADKILLRKRALIETVNDELKNIAQIEHSRHRSFNNFIANSLSAIAAYCFFEKKPPLTCVLSKTGNLLCFELYRTHVKIDSNYVRHCTVTMISCSRTIRRNGSPVQSCPTAFRMRTKQR